MRKRLGGWTRVGIILSVIWFFGFAGYWWNYGHRDADKYLELQGRTCKLFLDQANKLPGADTSASWARYQNCTSRAIATWQTAVRYNNKAIPGLLILSLITVGLSWLVIWGLVALTRWVRRGFAS
jgi:hypothetical protein